MAEDIGDKIAEGKLDLVPMIDCIMLLLLFFLLTSKFTSEEKAITSILPTDKGQSAAPSTQKVEPPKQVNIAVYPAGLPANLQPEDYVLKLKRMFEVSPNRILPDASIRVGGNAPVAMQGRLLGQQGSNELKQHMDQIHAYVQQNLVTYEKADAKERKDQFPIIIHCFSGMSWKFALVAYDAVREYERTKGAFANSNDPLAIQKQREVDFAPPRIRNYSAAELGQELFEIINLLK